MEMLITMVAVYLGVMIIGHRQSTKKSGYTLMQTLFLSFAEKE